MQTVQTYSPGKTELKNPKLNRGGNFGHFPCILAPFKTENGSSEPRHYFAMLWDQEIVSVSECGMCTYVSVYQIFMATSLEVVRRSYTIAVGKIIDNGQF